MESKYDLIEVTLEPENYDRIKEVYRLNKEQANRLFDLSCGIKSDEDIMDLIKYRIENDIVFLVLDTENNRYSGCITFEGIKIYNDEIINVNVHPIISKKYWGKASRDIIEDIYKFLENNWLPINRITAKVPSNNLPVIKLLKDVGFRIEGTCNNMYVFKDKNGVAKKYNQLIYSDINRRK